MKKLGKIIYIITIIIFIISCRNSQNKKNIYIPEHRLEKALEIAGENKSELIKVLDNYKSDSLKFRAAVYLIENMIDLSTDKTDQFTKNDDLYKYSDLFYPVIDSLLAIYASIDDKKNILQLTNKLLSAEGTEGIVYNPIRQLDLKYIKSDYIIKNIDLAFTAWQTYPWSRKCTFNDFCEFVLPYRLIYPYWEKAREFFFNKYKNLPDSFYLSDNRFALEKYIEKDFKQWYNGKWGNCYHKGILITLALRSVGIPATFETVPQWGNMDRKHYFYKVIDNEHDTIRTLIDNRNIAHDTRHIISGAYYDEDIEHLRNAIDSKFYISYNKTIPKVFRNCFGKQYNSLAYIAPKSEKIPDFFKNDRLFDVTDTYLKTCDVKLKIKDQEDNQFAYLCVFNRKGWVPVHWAKIDNNKIIFDKMGKNIVYLPAIFKKDSIHPVGPPFILTQNGKIQKLIPKKKTETILLYRKYFLTTHVIFNASECIGTRFQGANKPDLSDTTTFYTINKLTFSMAEIPVHDKNKYRFLLFQFKGKDQVSLGELEFWGYKNGNESLLSGTYLGNPGGKNKDTSKLSDKDILSFYANSNFSDDSYVGIDLGENNETQVTKILFCPRNDNNNINEGHLYELFYWDNKWLSLGMQKGKKSYPLKYKNVPVGALLYLRNHTAGNEERIFTYKDGKQIWW